MSGNPSLSSSGSSSSSFAVLGGHGSSMKEATLDEAFYRNKMALFLTYFWFFFVKSLRFSIGFIAKHLFGIGIGREKVRDDHRREENSASPAKGARSPEPILEKKTMMESDVRFCETSEEEKEDSGFTFKFQYQIPNFPAEFSMQEPLMPVAEKETLLTTSLKSFQFLPAKDLGGFIASPEAKTFPIEESFDHENLFSTEDFYSLSANNYGEEIIEAIKHGTSQMIQKPPETRHEEFLESETTKEEPADVNADKLVEVEGSTNMRLLFNDLVGCDLDTKSPINSGCSSVNDHVLVSKDVETANLKLGIDTSSFKYGNPKHAKEDPISSQSSMIGEKLQHQKPLKEETFVVSDTKLGKKIVNEDLIGTRSSIKYELQKPLKEEKSKGSDTNKMGKTTAAEDLVTTRSSIIFKKLQQKNPLKQDRIKGSGTKMSRKTRKANGARFMAEDFFGFYSDFDSASESDGYSVKDLIIESDDKENSGTKHDDRSRLSAKNVKRTASEVKRLDAIYIQPTVKEYDRRPSNKTRQQKKIIISGNNLSTQFSPNKLSSQLQKDNAASFLTEEFYSSDSDVESLSESDGYSVKDLVEDSEGFLSERDFYGSEDVLTTTEDVINAHARKVEVQKDTRISREAQLQYLQRCAAVSDSSDDKFVYNENQSKSMEHFLDDLSENVNLDENLLVNTSCNPGTEHNTLNEVTGNNGIRKFDQKNYPDSSIRHMEFTDSSDDDLVYPLKNNFTSMKSFDELVNQDIETRDFDGKKAEDDKFGYEKKEVRLNKVTGKNEIGKFYQTQILDPSLQHIEFTDSSDDELVYPIKNSFASMKSFDELANQNAENGDSDEKESENVKLDAYSDVVSRPSSVGSDVSVSLTDVNDQVETKDDSETKAHDHSTQNSKGKQLDLDDEDYDDLESLWEHHGLVEQLRMELKRVRAVGLPTILEESETPKTVEDLKPWKIDEKFMHENPMDELQKFHKSYNEKMRKLDILNYQKLYALGFFKQKDPLESMVLQKPLISTIASILSHNFRSVRGKSNTTPSESFIKELHAELELVYVGQTCLSWEFLRWQYEKAMELPESDPYRDHRYNHAAGEFQQFQVVLQRFIENEPFQGPRLLNYVRNRCVLKNLLQVPVIKEDSLKEKREDQLKGNYIITREMQEDIIEESIRIFWEFVKADKDETPGILKAFKATHSQLQDPSDYDLVSNIQSDLQKKYKKLKDILRTGNCIIKKFKKPKEDRTNQDLFFSQVDLKLVARVLRMSRITTDQLVWCHKKLDRIMVVDRKIYRESSFLQFPC